MINRLNLSLRPWLWQNRLKILIYSVLLLLASIPMTWFASNFRSFDGWWSVVLTSLLALGLIALGWRLLRSENPPQWLLYLTLSAFVLHVVLGMLWMLLLPRYGHNTQAELEGYIMGDAYARDNVAWRLARSNAPLWSAFSDNRKVDQYGGLLFISAAIYRYLGSDFKQPLLVILIAAAFSALAVAYIWAFARLAWGPGEARLSAWLMLIYPEALLLGSSQMREAFVITLASAAFYGLLRFYHRRDGRSLLWLVIPLLVCVPFSPPAASMLLAALLLTAGGLFLHGPLRNVSTPRLWLALGAVTLVMLVGLYLALRQFTPERMVNPFEMLSWWLTKSAHLQSLFTQRASGWLQKVLDSLPLGLHFPLLLIYGVLQPLLPAAVVARTGAPVWYGITLWRALGWNLLLPFVLYAPFLALRRRDKRLFNLLLGLAMWGVILVASYRGGADLWDNPRYRVMLAGPQLALAAWTIIEHRRLSDPWLRRVTMGVAVVLAWFMPWYLLRYFSISWPVVDYFKTIGLGVVSAFLLIIWDWARINDAPIADLDSDDQASEPPL